MEICGDLKFSGQQPPIKLLLFSPQSVLRIVDLQENFNGGKKPACSR